MCKRILYISHTYNVIFQWSKNILLRIFQVSQTDKRVQGTCLRAASFLRGFRDIFVLIGSKVKHL